MYSPPMLTVRGICFMRFLQRAIVILCQAKLTDPVWFGFFMDT